MSNITLYNDDCFNTLTSIPDNSIDLILIDPPYNTLSCSWDKNIDVEKLFKEYWRVLKEPGVILVFADVSRFMSKVSSSDSNYKYSLIWKKNIKTGNLNAKYKPLSQLESICVFFKKGKGVYNPQMIKGASHRRGSTAGKAYANGGSTPAYTSDEYYPSNLLEFDSPPVNNRLHTSQKPVDLLEWLIKSYSNENTTVLDTFMGSGSTMVACINTNRNGIGIEMNKDYFNIAKQRIEENKNEDTVIQ